MYSYKIDFTVNGIRTRLTVQAKTPMDAKRLVQAQYAGSHITFWSVTRQ